MKKCKELKPDHVYVFTSKSAANSNYIESISEAKKIFTYASYFLKNYLNIYEYNITRHGFQMVVKIKNLEQLNDAENIQLDRSQITNLISERMRLFISHYVICINKMRGRTGSLVHSKYEKQAFESILEAREWVENIRKKTKVMYQRKRKYRGLKSHYRIPKRLGKGSIFLCSKELEKYISRKKKEGQKFIFNQVLRDFQELVVPNKQLFSSS